MTKRLALAVLLLVLGTSAFGVALDEAYRASYLTYLTAAGSAGYFNLPNGTNGRPAMIKDSTRVPKLGKAGLVCTLDFNAPVYWPFLFAPVGKNTGIRLFSDAYSYGATGDGDLYVSSGDSFCMWLPTKMQRIILFAVASADTPYYVHAIGFTGKPFTGQPNQ